jgi:hypothetical protein
MVGKTAADFSGACGMQQGRCFDAKECDVDPAFEGTT